MERARPYRSANINPVKRSDGLLPEIASTHTEPYTNYILRLLFEASPDGFFVMMLDEPVMWDPATDDPALFDHIFQTQKITIFNTRSAELNPAFDGNLMGVTPERYFYYDVANGRAAWKKLLKTGWLNMETSESIAPGMNIWIETEFVNIYDQDGLLLGCFATQRDITLKNAEVDTLTASSSELSAAIAAVGDPFIMVDANGVITYLNYTAEVTLDLSYDRLVNKKLTDLLQIIDPDSGLDLKQILDQVKKTGIANRLGNKAKLKYGINETAVTGVISSVKNADGSHIGWILLLRYPGDVLKEIVEDTVNLGRMKKLNRSLAAGYWEIDLHKGAVWISDEIFELYGINRTLEDDPEELKFLQNKINEMIVPEDRPKVEKAATDLIHDFKGYVVDYRLFDPSKTLRYIRSIVEVHNDESGTPVLISGAAIDLTWYYNHLATSSFFEQIIEGAPLGIMVTDPSGIIQYANQKLAEITGYSVAELLGQKPSLLKSGVLPPVFYENLWKVVLSGDIWQGDIINRKKDGTHYWDSGAISGLKGKDGGIERLVAFKQDVTARKKLESDIKKQKDNLDRLHKEKIALLEDLNLEIRNPLNGISGFLDLLISEVTDMEHRKILRSIKHSAGRVLNRLDAVSDILNMEKDSWSINLRSIEPGAALREVLDYYREIAEDKGLRFESYIQDGLSLVTDPGLIAKATGNLINNAVKFTSDGTVRVEVVRPPASDDEILFRVTDTGPGIKKDEIDAIFSDALATQSDLTRTVESTGFGLRVTKDIIKRLGGTIKIESVPGKRTTFTIILSPETSVEVAGVEADRLKYFKKASSSSLRQELLIVEDSKMNSEVMALYLKKICAVDTARSGDQAVRLAEGKRYAAVILDINLGEGLSGVDTMKKIRKLPGYEDVPFIAVTGYALNADRAQIVEEGFDFFYTKPLDMSSFTSFIKELVIPEEG